jgi:NAD(P)-dependent dehydrogenase (short-subunit alcohol dehydrogenase family)
MSTSSIPETPTGVVAVLTDTIPPTGNALSQFLLLDKVAIVTGGHRGIGLEIALAFAESGAIVYCIDLPPTPDEDWVKVCEYATKLPSLDPNDSNKRGRLEYISADVTDQSIIAAKIEQIVEREGRVDVCVANAGILREFDCLEYPADEFKKVW